MTLNAQIFKLFWLQVKMQLGLSAMKYYRVHDKKKYRMNIFVIIAAAYGIGSMLFVYGMVYGAVVKSALTLGLGSLILAATVLAAMVIVLIFGAFQINALVFNARDIEWYACLPLKPQAVFASKFGIVYAIEFIITTFVLIPAYLLYAIESGAGILFWIIAAVTLPLVPVIPLSLSAILALPLSKLSSKFRRRELVTVIFTLALAAAAVAFSIAMTGSMGLVIEGGEAALDDFFAGAEPMLKISAAVFPPAMWLSSGLTMSGGAVSSLLLFISVSILALLLAVRLSGKFYYAGTLSMLETPAARQKNAGFRSSAVKSSSPVFTLAAMDIKLILRSPVYAMNSLSGLIFAVMIFVMPLIIRSEWEELMVMLDEGIDAASPALMIVIAVLILALAGMINPAASTSLSRAGRAFWIYRVIPMTPRSLITAKLLGAAAISLFSSVMVAVSVCVIIPALIPFALMAFIPAALTGVATTAFSMIPDIINPKLRWDNENEAMKQNMNTIWGMLLAMLPPVAAALILPVVILIPAMSATAALVILLVITAGMAFGGLCLTRWMADSRFAELGEKL